MIEYKVLTERISLVKALRAELREKQDYVRESKEKLYAGVYYGPLPREKHTRHCSQEEKQIAYIEAKGASLSTEEKYMAAQCELEEALREYFGKEYKLLYIAIRKFVDGWTFSQIGRDIHEKEDAVRRALDRAVKK